jgi:KaiC/GvpD/RAD55 family RecA-like ATPase
MVVVLKVPKIYRVTCSLYRREQMSKNSSALPMLTKICPKIYGFDDLFLEKDAKGWAPNTKVLISGPPGAGKTTFALSLVRGQITKLEEEFKNDRQIQKQHIRVYYLSPEVDRDRLKSLYVSRGWFGDADVFSLPRKNQNETFAVAFCPISPRVEFDRPVRSSEDVINDILHRIRQDNLHAYPHDRLKLFIIVDSITALLRDCPNTGEERRKTHELLLRLQAAFPPESVQLNILLAEADEGTASATSVSVRGEAHVWPQQTLVAIEDYLVDVVFRLSLRREHQGDRTRVLDVSKSQGTNMAIGEHTWAIVTNTNHQQITGLNALQRKIQPPEVPPADTSTNWGTIAIFPNPFATPSAPCPTPGAGEYVLSGTDRLDGLIRVDADKTSPGGLRAGSTTLFVGPPGSGTTFLALQFLYAGNTRVASAQTPTGVRSQTNNPDPTILFISFDARGVADLAGFTNARANERQPQTIFRTRDKLDINILIAEVRAALAPTGTKTETQIERVAIDGISDWLAGEHHQEVADLVEALLKAIREYNVNSTKCPPTIVIAYDHVESVEPDDPLAPSSLGLSADNIVVVRQIHIQDQRHRIIYVVKSETEASPMVRELEARREETPKWKYVVGSGLDGYTDLLTDKPRPAQITLQLFGENKAQDDYNLRLLDHLRSLYGYKFKAYHFSRSEIESTLNDVNSQTRVLAADLKLVTLDEWWIGQLKPKLNGRYALTALNEVYSGNSSVDESGKPSGKPSDGHMFNPSKYWIPEIEKATHVEPVQSNEKGKKERVKPTEVLRTRIFACPLTLDYGILCFNPFSAPDRPPEDRSWNSIWKTSFGALASRKAWSDPNESELVRVEDAPQWDEFWSAQARRVPRYWTALKSEGNHRWFQLGDITVKSKAQNDPKTIVEFLGRIRMEKPSAIGFAFDSVTRETACCVLLELAWAFGAPEHFLVPAPKEGAGRDFHETNYQKPLKTALLFLQFMIVEKLMPANPTLMQTAKAILSRQFYSTRRYVHEHMRELDPKTPFHLLPLPLMPAGTAEDKQDFTEVRDDNIRRCGLLLDRLRHKMDAMKSKLQHRGEDVSEVQRLMQHAEKLAKQPEAKRLQPKWLTSLNKLVDSTSNLPGIDFQAAPETEDDFSASFGLRMHAAARTSLDRRDILELQHWAQLRQSFQDGGEPFLKEAGMHGPYGYGCSGSWMLGIHSSTRSPSLAKDLMSEIASLKFAEKRALNGAGMPARKDFYAFHGEEPVPDAPYFKWSQMFRYSAATARRRDKAICASVPAPMLFRELHHVMMQCMSEADRLTKEYGANRQKTVEQFNKYVDSAVASIFAKIDHLAVRSGNKADCRSCVAKSSCGLADHPE